MIHVFMKKAIAGIELPPNVEVGVSDISLRYIKYIESEGGEAIEWLVYDAGYSCPQYSGEYIMTINRDLKFLAFEVSSLQELHLFMEEFYSNYKTIKEQFEAL